MKNESTSLEDDNFDNKVDEEILGCLSLESPASFFMFAGAGSGKTRSLVSAIESVVATYRNQLLLRGQLVGVITYTNAACDEIKRRIDFDPLVQVSTIHSFVWKLIEGFNTDIKEWLKHKLNEDIADLELLQSKSRGANKTTINRAKKIDSKKERLKSLGVIRKFIYNPDGDNVERDSLNHTEVIGLAADFLSTKSAMQQILVNRFPILLIDESQDTNALLMDAVIKVQAKWRSIFSVGLFGDAMQRIYNDGKSDLGQNLPSDWKTPAKAMNHRCPPRVVKLINKVRSGNGEHEQRPRSDKNEGIVRLFLVQSSAADKAAIENKVATHMESFTKDTMWVGAGAEVKKLILEHHMASTRLGFAEMFEPLYKSGRLKTGLLDGSLPGIHLFSRQVMPVVEARASGDEFAVARIVRQYSPLLKKQALLAAGDQQVRNLESVRSAVAELCQLWSSEKSPTFGEIANLIAKNGLFTIPHSLQFFTARTVAEQETVDTEEEVEETATDDSEESEGYSTTDAWDAFLATNSSQMTKYVSYIEGNSGFGTHQGVKGLEYPRVMVIKDDTEAGGFLFGYDKQFGAKARTKGYIENEREGKDTGIDRTKRLFYVTCSRAEESLALVAYSESPQAVRAQLLKDEWFEDGEIIDLT